VETRLGWVQKKRIGQRRSHVAIKLVWGLEDRGREQTGKGRKSCGSGARKWPEGVFFGVSNPSENAVVCFRGRGSGMVNRAKKHRGGGGGTVEPKLLKCWCLRACGIFGVFSRLWFLLLLRPAARLGKRAPLGGAGAKGGGKRACGRMSRKIADKKRHEGKKWVNKASVQIIQHYGWGCRKILESRGFSE